MLSGFGRFFKHLLLARMAAWPLAAHANPCIHGSRVHERGGTLIEVIGAMGIGAVVLLMFTSSTRTVTQDSLPHQLAWSHRAQYEASSQVLQSLLADWRARNAYPQDLQVPGRFYLVPDLDFAQGLPEPMRQGVGNAQVPRANALNQKACLVIQRKFVQNVTNQMVPTDFFDAFLVQTGGRTGSAPNTLGGDLRIAMSQLTAHAVPVQYMSYPGMQGVLMGDRFANEDWEPIRNALRANPLSAAQCHAGFADDWRARLVTRWQVDGFGNPVVQDFNPEFLARSVSDRTRWLQTMEAPLWLGRRESGLGNVQQPVALAALSSLPRVNGLSATGVPQPCNGNQEGFFAIDQNTTPDLLLQCRYDTGLFRWKPTRGVVAAGQVMAQTLYPLLEVEEGVYCNDYALGHIARHSSGAPMVCTATGQGSERVWIRVGVPWSWVMVPQQLHSGASEFLFRPSDHNIPASARLVQLYLEADLPPGRGGEIMVQEFMDDAGGIPRRQGNPVSIMRIAPFTAGNLGAVMGRPRMFDNPEGVRYRFYIELDDGAVGGGLTVGLLGYSY